MSQFQDYGFEHGSTVPLHFVITEYHLDILPLDSDVISLDIPTAFMVGGWEGGREEGRGVTKVDIIIS